MVISNTWYPERWIKLNLSFVSSYNQGDSRRAGDSGQEYRVETGRRVKWEVVCIKMVQSWKEMVKTAAYGTHTQCNSSM